MEKLTPLVAYGEKIVELYNEYPNLVVLVADMINSTGTRNFSDRFPHRFIDVGIAEQNMFSMAAGLAIIGFIPLVNTFAVFASMRACEQVRTSIAYPNLSVKIIGTNAGITASRDGATHQAIEDIAIMRSIPNMTVLVPADGVSTGLAIEEAIKMPGPVYIRLSKTENTVYKNELEYRFTIGKAITLRDGQDLTIICCGDMVSHCLQISIILQQNERIRVRVIDMHTVKPIDSDSILKAARETRAIVVVENHSTVAGLSGAICEFLCEHYPTVVEKIGINDVFTESGSYDELRRKYKLDDESIIAACKRALLRKNLNKYAYGVESYERDKYKAAFE